MLALLVLHRAKLLASNQSILALGVAPRQVAGTPVPVFPPFRGKGGRGDRDNKSEVNSKADFSYNLLRRISAAISFTLLKLGIFDEKTPPDLQKSLTIPKLDSIII